jgi:DNA polymerase III epsilon subunit-like protein
MTKFKYSAPIHLNGNLFCAVDTETTGLDPEKHSVIEVCVLPLNSDYSINKSILPFNMQMQPIPGKVVDREAMTINKIDLPKVMTSCVDAYKAADLSGGMVREVEFATVQAHHSNRSELAIRPCLHYELVG